MLLDRSAEDEPMTESQMATLRRLAYEAFESEAFSRPLSKTDAQRRTRSPQSCACRTARRIRFKLRFYPSHWRPLMSPSALTDSQMACVQDAARHIPPWPRGRFQQQFVEALGLPIRRASPSPLSDRTTAALLASRGCSRLRRAFSPGQSRGQARAGAVLLRRAVPHEISAEYRS